jgi:hypothetical protein
MATIHFTGRIVPVSGIDITAKDLPPVAYVSAENDINATFAFLIDKSSVSVRCDLNRFEDTPDFLALIHKPAFDLTQAVISLLGFQSGRGLTLCFEYLIMPDGAQTYLARGNQALAPLCTAFSLTVGMPEVLRIVLTDFNLCIALNELNEALTLTHHAISSCGRCVERLRTVMSPGVDRKRAWVKFGATLQLSKGYLDVITDQSKGPRHGDTAFIPGTVELEVMKRTWVTVNRFLEYRKRGSLVLPVSEFPLL